MTLVQNALDTPVRAAPDAVDPRLRPVPWDAADEGRSVRRRMSLLLPFNLLATVWYFGWLLQPDRVGSPVLYGVLVVAELFNLVQVLGFWWTVRAERVRPSPPWDGPPPAVDVLLPTYNESVDVVEPALAAATRLRGGQVDVWLLDDGDRPEMAALAARHGAGYLTRDKHTGAKAGNINAALKHISAPYVLVLDCDHVADPAFLEETMGHFTDERMGFVQTPQYYANAAHNPVAAAAWSQQALFFGAIARGKDGMDAMFCCGTGVVFRRAALEDVGGFPTDSVTEDFQLSLLLHERGWRSAYVPQVLASGLGPEDMSSYASQQLRWSRGCLSALPATLRARLPWRQKTQYLLSSLYFLSGWTVLIYLTFPMLRILLNLSPVDVDSADEFLLHFAPYFVLALLSVAVAGSGSYTFRAFALQSASCWIHALSTVRTVLRRPGGFVVTPKEGAGTWQPRAVAPALVLIVVLSVVAVYGLLTSPTPGIANAAAFSVLHLSVLSAGAGLALRRSPRLAPRPAEPAHGHDSA